GAHGGTLLLPAHPSPAATDPRAARPRERALDRRRGADARRHVRHREGPRRRERDGRDLPRHERPDAQAGHRATSHRGRGGVRGRGRGARNLTVTPDADPAPTSRDLTDADVSREDAEAVPSDDQDLHAPAAAEAIPLTLEVIQENPELSGFISAADGVMEALGYTEHGFRHANLTGRIAFQVL